MVPVCAQVAAIPPAGFLPAEYTFSEAFLDLVGVEIELRSEFLIFALACTGVLVILLVFYFTDIFQGLDVIILADLSFDCTML